MERSLLGILGTFRDEGFTYDFYARPGGVVETGASRPEPKKMAAIDTEVEAVN